MFAIRLITIFCLFFLANVHSESDFCCVKHKYVQDTRGFYIKKCVLGTTCPGGNENNYIFDENFLAAQQNYVEQLKRSQNYNEKFQNYIKDYEDFVTFLHNYVTRGKTVEKYNTLVNKYQQLEDEYNDYIKENFPNGDKVEDNRNIDRKRRSVDRGQVNKQNSYNLDEDYLMARRNYREKLKNYDDKFINNKDLQNYVTGAKTMDKYNNLVKKYKQLEAACNNHDKVAFPNNDQVEESPEDIDTESEDVDDQNDNIYDEDSLVTQQNHLEKLKEYADNYQKHDEKFQTFIKNYENYVKELENYVRGAKTTDKYTSLINTDQQLDDEYNDYVKENFPKSDKDEESPEDIDTESKDVDDQDDIIYDEDSLVKQQNYLEKLKEYADNYQKYDEKFQTFIKNNEHFVKELENYVRGVKTTDKYTSLINTQQQLDDEYDNYVKENFPTSDKGEESPEDIDTEDKSGENTKVNNQKKFIINKEYLVAQQNYLKKLEEYADEHQIDDEKFQIFFKHNEDFVNDLQHFVTGVKTTEKYNSLVNKYQQLQDEYDNYVKEKFPNSDEFDQTQTSIARKRRSVESEEYSLYDKINPDATAYEKCLWKYNKYGSTVCDQLKSLAYWENLAQMFPFRVDKEYNSVVDKMVDDIDDEDEDNNINVLGPADGKSMNQNERIDSLLTAAPNCFEGSGSLAHNNLCKLEFYDY